MPKPPAEAAKTTRLSAEDRRAQILDSTTALILEQGLSHCSLEEVAVQAGISKALIYRHFSSRDELLKALLERELAVLRGRGLGAFPRDTPFDRVLLVSTRQAFDYLHERGPILRALFSDPAVARLLSGRERDERMGSTRFFVDKAMRAHGLPLDVAQIVSIMIINAPMSGARALRRFGFTSDRTAEVWTEFLLGGWKAVADRYGERAPREEPPPVDGSSAAPARKTAPKTARKTARNAAHEPAAPSARKRTTPR